MTTLRDALETAFDSAPEVESTTVETTPGEVVAEATEVVESASEKTARARDESGRFAAKTEEAPVEAETAPVVEEKSTRKAPSSWKKDYWGNWEKLGADPELAPLQDYIEQRESEFAKGVSTYREEAMKAKDLQEAIAPFMPVLQQHGLNPAQHVRALMSAHQVLSQGSSEQKLQMFQRLATDYGVPLQGVVGQADPQQFQVLSELNALKQQLGSFQQTAQQREQAEIASRIESFKSNASHFEDVRESMAGLLQAGIASDLQDAYEKAIRLNDAVWTKVQAEKAQTAAQVSAKRVADKKATAVSPRSSAPTGRVAVAGGNDIRSALGAAFEQYQAGRL
jgi:hypothetical protein